VTKAKYSIFDSATIKMLAKKSINLYATLYTKLFLCFIIDKSKKAHTFRNLFMMLVYILFEYSPNFFY